MHAQGKQRKRFHAERTQTAPPGNETQVTVLPTYLYEIPKCLALTRSVVPLNKHLFYSVAAFSGSNENLLWQEAY